MVSVLVIILVLGIWMIGLIIKHMGAQTEANRLHKIISSKLINTLPTVIAFAYKKKKKTSY